MGAYFKDNQNKLKTIVVAIITAGITAIAVTHFDVIWEFLGKAFKIANPFIWGLIIAYLLAPVVNNTRMKLSKQKLFSNTKESTLDKLAISIVETLFIILLTIIVSIIGIGIVNSGYNIAQQAPKAFVSIQDWVDKQIEAHETLRGIIGDSTSEFIKDTSNSIIDSIAENFQEVLAGVISKATSITKNVLNVVFGVIISIFALANRSEFKRQSLKLLRAVTTPEKSSVIVDIIKGADTKFSGFFIGKIIDSTIVGIISIIVMSIMGMPYVLLNSIIIFVTNIVPIVGPIIGAVPCFIIILSESPIKSVYFLVFILILQQIDGHVIGPKCIGTATGLNTFYTLFALIFFGGIWGMAGMVIGVPLFSVIKDIITRFVNMRTEAKKIR